MKNSKIKKYFFLLFIFTLFFSVNSYSDVLKRDLKTKGTTYFYSDKLFDGKAVEGRDRYYFQNGKANGKWISFYKNGNIKSIVNWKDGKLNGKYIIYLKNGTKISEVYYSMGKENGSYLIFFQNGKPRITGQYSNAKPVGIWKFYNKKGKLIGKNNLK